MLKSVLMSSCKDLCYVCVCTHEYRCPWRSEGEGQKNGGQKMDSGLAGSVVPSSYEPPNISVGNRIQVL